jgi:DNA-directed RNA polymerase III subunit RPC4
MFQFPNLFPKFEDTRPVEIADETKPLDAPAAPTANGNASPEKAKDIKPDIKPEIKPTPAQLRGAAKKYGVKPPEGRIGSLVVMRSGRVKMVLGDGIVMNVSPHSQSCMVLRYVWPVWLIKGPGITRCRNHLLAATRSS